MNGTIMQIDSLYKSKPVTAHSSITATATSVPICAEGKNAVLIQFITSAANNWTIKLTGSFTKHGTYTDLYELANTGAMAQMLYQLNSNKMFLFKGIPNWIKIVATEDADGSTVSVYAQLLNV